MPNRTVRANATGLPKNNPDAALLAKAAECLILERAMKEAGEAYDEAEERRAAIETPRAIIRTEDEANRRLVLGTGLGEPYTEDEIEALRVLVRSLGRSKAHRKEDTAAYLRGREILTAWASWRKWVDEDEERVGFTAAVVAHDKAYRAHDKAVAEIIATPAQTIEGVIAKARAGAVYLETPEGLDGLIEEGLRDYGTDREVIAISLTRDLLAMSDGGR
jgi:hypothetical protein